MEYRSVERTLHPSSERKLTSTPAQRTVEDVTSTSVWQRRRRLNPSVFLVKKTTSPGMHAKYTMAASATPESDRLKVESDAIPSPSIPTSSTIQATTGSQT